MSNIPDTVYKQRCVTTL